MNIFILDLNPKHAAAYHNNKHVVKMITEHTQMMNAVCDHYGFPTNMKPTHVNHPCTLWLHESAANWRWLFELQFYLHKEWQFRFGHPRSRWHQSYFKMTQLMMPKLPDIGRTPFALAMPDYYQDEDPVFSYRRYYIGEKSEMGDWGARGKPDWWPNV